jgi:hypothetical protein
MEVIITHPSIKKINKHIGKDVYKGRCYLNGWNIIVKVDGNFSRFGETVVVIASFAD